MADARWPPIYDFDELSKTIRSIVDAPAYEKQLYDTRPSPTSFFQGDVIRLPVELPYIGSDAEPRLEDAPPYWSVLGNTCDFDRSIDDVAFSQLVPVWNLGPRATIPPTDLRELRRYRYYTQFFLPPWEQVPDDVHVVDFLRPVNVHKAAFSCAEVVARLSRPGWILYHSCVVRFFARDDGRHDEA